MPHRLLTLEGVCQYLHLSEEEVRRRVKAGEIPHEKRGQRIVFPKQAIDAWASQRLLRMPSERLTEYHRKATLEVREFLPHQALLPEMIEPKGIAPGLPARTKASVLRELVSLARNSGRLNDAPSLIRSLEEREALCSTGMPGGFAVPHPRVPDPYLCESSVIVLGRTSQQIPFGAPDGRGTDLFFLICCQDDRLHLHTLARLCLMAQKTPVLEELRQAGDAESMHSLLLAAEQEVLMKLKT